MDFSAKARAASRNASWSSDRLKSIVQLPFTHLPELNGEVGFRRRRLAVEPAGGHGLGFGVETHCLLAVSVLVTVERPFPACEREERQGHRNGNIHTHLAHFDFVLEPAGGATVVGEDRGAVAVRAVVDQLDRFAKVIGVHTGQYRPEDFFFVDVHLRRDLTDQGGPYPVTVRQSIHGTTATVQHQFCPSGLTSGNQAFNTLLGPGAGPRAIAGARIFPGTRAYFCHGFLEFRNPLLRSAYKHRHGDSHAALAGGTHRGTHQGIDHLLLVGIRHDHHVVLGASKALYALHVAGTGFVDITANRYRTDKGNGLDGRIVQQGIHLLLGTVYYLQNALGRTGFFEQFRQAHRGQRILLGRFQYKGVAAGDGQGEHPQGNHGREVERGDPDADAQGLHHAIGVNFPGHVLQSFAHHQGGNVAGVLNHFNAAPDIAFGVGKRLAGFLAESFRNFVLVFLEQGLIAEHQTCPCWGWDFFPGLEGVFGAGNGLFDLVTGGAGNFGQDELGRRIQVGKAAAGLTFNKLAIDEQGYLLVHGLSSCCLWQLSALWGAPPGQNRLLTRLLRQRRSSGGSLLQVKD